MHSQNEVIRREIECKFIYNQECFMAYKNAGNKSFYVAHNCSKRERERVCV